MRLSFVICFVAVTVVAVSSPLRAIAAERKTSTVYVSLDHPANLQTLTDRVAHVVQVEVTEIKTVARPLPVIGGTDVWTEIRGRIMATAKGSLRVGQSMICLQHAGKLETENEIVELLGETAISTPGVYVLFLNWNDALGSYVVVSSDGIYSVRQGILHPLGRAPVSEQQSGRSISMLFDDVRRRVRENIEK
jgi:hypothetical protein